jgi:hypothetical protein
MPHFAPLTISRAYASVAKSFASLREMNPRFSGSARRLRPISGLRRLRWHCAALRLGRADDGAKWRRKWLKLLKTGSKMAPRLADAREPIRRTPLSC